MTREQLIADSFVSLAVIAGLLVVLGVLRAERDDPMARRFRFGLLLLVILHFFRVLEALTGAWIFFLPLLTAAALVPLATVLIAEGLVRRHAPGTVKLLVVFGAAAIVLSGFFPRALVEPARGVALVCFQFAGFLIGGWMVVRRDRASLSSAENWLADRVALSLLLIVPLLVTDFRGPWLDMPVRLAGVAILFVCWIVIGMRRPGGHRETLSAFAAVIGAGLVGGAGVALIAGLDVTGSVQVIAVALSACLVAVIVNDSLGLKGEARRHGLLSHIAHSRETDPAQFLRSLRARLPVDGALILEAGDLADFDADVLAKAFAADPVRRRGPGTPEGGEESAEQLAALFERYDVTHLMLASATPLTIVALNSPAITSSPGLETELRAVQRVAFLIAEKAGADTEAG